MKYRVEIKQDILRRANIAEGQLKKVISMIQDDEALCMDILNQSLAIQSALKKVDEIILENHMRKCISQKTGNKCPKQAIDEVLEAFKKRR